MIDSIDIITVKQFNTVVNKEDLTILGEGNDLERYLAWDKIQAEMIEYSGIKGDMKLRLQLRRDIIYYELMLLGTGDVFYKIKLYEFKERLKAFEKESVKLDYEEQLMRMCLSQNITPMKSNQTVMREYLTLHKIISNDNSKQYIKKDAFQSLAKKKNS